MDHPSSTFKPQARASKKIQAYLVVGAAAFVLGLIIWRMHKYFTAEVFLLGGLTLFLWTLGQMIIRTRLPRTTKFLWGAFFLLLIILVAVILILIFFHDYPTYKNVLLLIYTAGLIIFSLIPLLRIKE